MMRQHEYVDDPSASSYPVKELSEEEKTRVDGLTFDFQELTPDYIVYGLSRAFGILFATVWKTVEEVSGEDTARKVSYQIGRRFGSINFAAFLRSRGVQKGSPALMCEFQDKIHSVRGTVHISARFGRFDDKKCVVLRKRCIYHEWYLEGTAQFHGEFYRGLYDGYRQADQALKRVENPTCLFKRDDCCEHIFIYED